MNDYKNQVEFFEKCGDQYVHPKSYGECIYAVTVEDMYQHFKERLLSELHISDIDSSIKVNWSSNDNT